MYAMHLSSFHSLQLEASRETAIFCLCIVLYRRCFETLGFDEYWNGHDDGLQVLRYNLTEAYIQHMDYLTDRSGMELYVSDPFLQFLELIRFAHNLLMDFLTVLHFFIQNYDSAGKGEVDTGLFL